MQRPGLYFPYIHVRDDEWLKATALYWPSIRRLVPHGYAKHDSRTARTFSDARILLDEEPAEYLASMGWNLLSVLRRNTDYLVRQFSVEEARTAWDGQSWSEGNHVAREAPWLGWIHMTKLDPRVTDYLQAAGLAVIGRFEQNVDWSHAGRPGAWIGLHPQLAGAYMTALAGRLSEEGNFEPVTDQTDLRVATASGDVQTAMNLLLGRHKGPDRADDNLGIEAYVMLALQYVHPVGLSAVPAEAILRCREDLEEELTTFREYVAAQQTALAELVNIPNRRRRLESFTEHVQQTVEAPLRKLEKGLLLHKLEPSRSLMLASSVMPPAAISGALSLAGAPPAAAATAGAVTAVGAAWWQITRTRRAMTADSPVGYLFDVRDQLTPRTVAARARKILRGTYSPAGRPTVDPL